MLVCVRVFNPSPTVDILCRSQKTIPNALQARVGMMMYVAHMSTKIKGV